MLSGFLVAIWTNIKFCHLVKSKPITRRKILGSSKLKEFADDNFKFDENGRKLFRQVENTVGKGGIARYEQFLLFPLCFQKACFPGASKGVIVWELVRGNQQIKSNISFLTFGSGFKSLAPVSLDSRKAAGGW